MIKKSDHFNFLKIYNFSKSEKRQAKLNTFNRTNFRPISLNYQTSIDYSYEQFSLNILKKKRDLYAYV